MHFSRVTVTLVSMLQLTSALPAERGSNSVATTDAPQAETSSWGGHEESNPLKARKACTIGADIELFKSDLCHGNPTRTDVVNWPLPENYVDRCQDVTSTSDMFGMTMDSDVEDSQLWIYTEPGCKGSAVSNLYSSCTTHYLDKNGAVPIKSFKMTILRPEKYWECDAL